MLSTYLKNVGQTKFVVIQDCLGAKAADILVHLIENFTKFDSANLLYFEFEFNKRVNTKLENLNKRSFVNYNEDVTGDCEVFRNVGKGAQILVIDSLAHMVFKFGLKKSYRLLNELRKETNIKQILTVLHGDLFEEIDDVFGHFKDLAQLYIELEVGFRGGNPRATYIYKKSAGKVIKNIEEYRFENNVLVTSPLPILDPMSLVQTPETLPETLTTFKISLGDRDKESREKFTLPYLPKDGEEESDGGTITYQFDEQDDWDEEDPDDDLDL